VMADCYSGNMSVILARGSKMTRMACWSHARRHVFEHQDNDQRVAAMPLALMNQLYDIERRSSQWSAEARGELRATESRMILDRLHEWLGGIVAQSVLPASKLGIALNYVRNHWDALCAYTQDGSLPIDNNQVERLMKRVAIGRKNWLFIGSTRAGVRNANLMSLVASALAAWHGASGGALARCMEGEPSGGGSPVPREGATGQSGQRVAKRRQAPSPSVADRSDLADLSR
jgi:transposase